VDHHRAPRNFRALARPTASGDGYNPLCGDRVTVELELADGTIRDIGFQGAGCAISVASASMMTAALRGRSVAEAGELFDRFHAMLTDGESAASADGALGKLAVFSGVREFPSRVKCATLPWHTLRAALAGGAEPVSTE